MSYECAIDGEPATFHKVSTHTRCRGEGKCSLCEQPIVPGQKYRKERAIWEGDPYSLTVHIPCHELMESAALMLCGESYYLWDQTLDDASKALVAMNVADPGMVPDEDLREWLGRHEAIAAGGE